MGQVTKQSDFLCLHLNWGGYTLPFPSRRFLASLLRVTFTGSVLWWWFVCLLRRQPTTGVSAWVFSLYSSKNLSKPIQDEPEASLKYLAPFAVKEVATD